MLIKIRKQFRVRAIMFVLAGLVSVLSAAPAYSENGGLLFIQVHITNPLKNISPEQLGRILNGEVSDFSRIGGARGVIHIYADSRIAAALHKAFPRLRSAPLLFGWNEDIVSDRAFLGISDVRGLAPWFKALYVDSILPWGRIHDDYSLTDPGTYLFSMNGAGQWRDEFGVTIVQTGVTAMTRAFIAAVDRAGDILHPVRHTHTITARADIALTSNEVSFLDPCSYPLKDRMSFCSPVRFFRILEHSGFDVIELTGNHNNDYGRRFNSESIDMMDRAGMAWFGGGRSREEAERVLYKKTKKYTFAFAGFNEIGPEYAWAGIETAGASKLSEKLFRESVGKAVAGSDAAFVSVQWGNENDPVPWTVQRTYFHLAAGLGASIMVSSSAHRAMGLEFYGGKLISYGLGNFLFDQMQTLNHRRGLIARHHFYGGRHIQTEFIPYIIHDYCQPRPVHGSEARQLMDEVFRHSLGPVFQQYSSKKATAK